MLYKELYREYPFGSLQKVTRFFSVLLSGWKRRLRPRSTGNSQAVLAS